jgi:DNA-binding IclR family transcriptional regulator
VAAPIFDHRAQVAGVCAVAGPTDRVRPQARRLAGEAKRTARAISALLGYRAVDDRKSTGRTS